MKIQGGLFYMCKLSRRYTLHTISLIIGAIKDFYEERTPNDDFYYGEQLINIPCVI
jgi:hypothetical protein